MDKDFLNEIEFEKDIKLKKPKTGSIPEQSPKERARAARIKKKLFRLLFFIATLIMLWYGGKYAIESLCSFCKGTEHMSFEEIKKGVSEQYKENERY